MTAPLTGYTTSLPSDILLDSGVLYVGAAGSSKVWGAFQGGLKFDPGVTYRNAEFDGKRSPVKGLDRISMRMPKISGTCIALPDVTTNVAGAVVAIEPGATTATTGAWTASTSFAPKAAGALLVTGDYLSDVRLIFQRGGTTASAGSYVQVRFPSGLCTKYDITGQDGAEVAIALEIEARLDPTLSGFSNVGASPFRIEYLATV
jgi:hypothetical protein